MSEFCETLNRMIYNEIVCGSVRVQIPGLCANAMKSSMAGVVRCETLVGYRAVYRLCFGMSMSFLVFFLLTINIKNSRDPRAAFHNG